MRRVIFDPELIWIILRNGVPYEERGPTVCEKAKRVRTSRMIRTPSHFGSAKQLRDGRK